MIELQPFSLDNVRLHYKWNIDREIGFYDSEANQKFESFESFLSRMKSSVNSSNETSKLFEIVESESGRVIGVVDLYGIDFFNKRCFVSCTIGEKKYRGRGYGKEALNQSLKYCFKELDMKKVGATSLDFNHTWQRVLMLVGFRREGILRNHICKEGVFRNKIIYSMLESEYRAKTQKTAQNSAKRFIAHHPQGHF